MKSINRGIVLTIVLAAFMVIPATVFGDILPLITETEVVYDDTNMIMVKINIFGHNFGATVGTVKLGDTPLQVENWFPKEIVAKLPQGIDPGSYLLVVTVPTRLLPLVAALGVTLGGEGLQGEPGPAGPAGPAGPTGPAGPAGPKGDKGDPGIQGIQGDKGDKGDKGETGATGAPGADGHSPVLTWSGDQIAIDGVVSGPPLTGPQGPPGPAGTSSMYDPQLIALQRWDLIQNSFTTTLGFSPAGMVFDGANIWVSNPMGAGGTPPTPGNRGSVVKIRASDGTILQTFSGSPLPLSPGTLGFDGAKIWVSSSTHTSPDRLGFIQIGDGTITSAAHATRVKGFVFDGSNMWSLDGLQVSPLGSIAAISITKYGSDGNLVQQVSVPGASARRYGSSIAFDGGYIWVGLAPEDCGDPEHHCANVLLRYDRNDLVNPVSVMCNGTVIPGTGIHSIYFDGLNLWFTQFHVVGGGGSRGAPIDLYKFANDSLQVQASGLFAQCQSATIFQSQPSSAERPVQMSYDGQKIWIAIQTDQYFNPGEANGAVLKVLDLGIAPEGINIQGPTGLVFDGTRMWIGDSVSQSLLRR